MRLSLTNQELTNALLWSNRRPPDGTDRASTAEAIQDTYGPLGQREWGGELQLQGGGTDLTLSEFAGTTQLRGTLDGRKENLDISEFAGTVRSQGAHRGAREDLSVSEFAGTHRLHGTHQGRSEDLSISEFAGTIHMQGTHQGQRADLKFSDFAGTTRVQGQWDGHDVHYSANGSLDGDRLVLQYLIR